MIKTKNNEIEEEEDDEEELPARKKGEPTRLSLLLNKYFHHLDRGGTLHSEVLAGIIVFFIAICMLFVNMQMVANSINGNITIDSSLSEANETHALTYATIYLASLIISFVSSIIIGLIARLPFIQLSMMGLGTNLLSLVSVTTGLSYYNLLFINLIAAVIYAVVVGVPVIRSFIYKALPIGVRKTLPAALGLILFMTCLSLSGLLSKNTVSINGLSNSTVTSINYYTLGNYSTLSTIQFQAMIGTFLAIVFLGLFKGLKLKHPYLEAFSLATVIFFVSNIITNGMNPSSDTSDPDSILNFGRIWVMAGSSASTSTPFGDSYLTYVSSAFSSILSNFGKVFTEGTDFSAFQGNTAVLVITGVIEYVFLGMYDLEGTLQSSESKINENIKDEKWHVDHCSSNGIYKTELINATTNVISPFLGLGSVRLGKSSLAGIEDQGKSGIVPLVSSIGFLISMFIMVFPALFATSTYVIGSMNEFSYYAYGFGGFIYLTSSLSFGIADAVIALVGLSMVKSLAKITWSDNSETIPALITLLFSFAFSSIGIGVSLGIISFFLIRIFNFHKSSQEKFSDSIKNFAPNFKTIPKGTMVLSGISIIYLSLLFFML